jgi:hypothetical protein
MCLYICEGSKVKSHVGILQSFNFKANVTVTAFTSEGLLVKMAMTINVRGWANRR